MKSLRFIPHVPGKHLSKLQQKGQESKKTPTSLTWICDSLDAWKQVPNIFSQMVVKKWCWIASFVQSAKNHQLEKSKLKNP